MQISEQVRAFLLERRFAVLATIGEDGLPHQTVMWYTLTNAGVLLNTARGRLKDKHLQREPRASICVEDGYRYVTLSGKARLDDDPSKAQQDIADLALRYEGATDRTERMIANFRTQDRVTIHLDIDNVIANGFEQ